MYVYVCIHTHIILIAALQGYYLILMEQKMEKLKRLSPKQAGEPGLEPSCQLQTVTMSNIPHLLLRHYRKEHANQQEDRMLGKRHVRDSVTE